MSTKTDHKIVMPHSPVEILGDPIGMLEKIL
jgi:hypothetical protein